MKMKNNMEKERMEEMFWQMMENNQFVKSTNTITDEVEEYPPAIIDMEAIVAIDGEFDKYAIDDWLRQAFTQARQAGIDEAVEIVKLILNREINILSQFRGDGHHDYAREYLEDIRKEVKTLQNNK